MNARVQILGPLHLSPHQQEINQSWSDAAYAEACRYIASHEPRNHAQLVMVLEAVAKSVDGMDVTGMGPVVRALESAVGAADFVFGRQG
jgi:hypothetical protein